MAILLATYNGEAYLQAQIDSLYAQTYTDWTLYIRDDGSSDDTPNIILQNANRHDNIVVLPEGNHQGAMRNFMEMLFIVDADYILFCDQDDVWLPQKIEKSLQRMQHEEALHPQQPVAVFTDLSVTDEQLRPLHPSFMRSSAIWPQYVQTFNQLAAGNIATGCTMLFNRYAADCAREERHAVMHDAWVTACVLKNKGVMACIQEPTVLYRQHTHNTLGAHERKKQNVVKRLLHAKETLHLNHLHYRMLNALGYGPVVKYIWYKALYKAKIYTHRD